MVGQDGYSGSRYGQPPGREASRTSQGALALMLSTHDGRGCGP
jgi:hypothetical protein